MERIAKMWGKLFEGILLEQIANIHLIKKQRQDILRLLSFRALFTKEQEQISAGWSHFLIPDNIHPYHNLIIDDAVLLARVVYFERPQLRILKSAERLNP